MGLNWLHHMGVRYKVYDNVVEVRLTSPLRPLPDGRKRVLLLLFYVSDFNILQAFAIIIACVGWPPSIPMPIIDFGINLEQLFEEKKTR